MGRPARSVKAAPVPAGATPTRSLFFLMAQYGAVAVVPIDAVARDYFSHLGPEKLVRKISAGEIALPLVRIEDSVRCHKGVPLVDLARYLDERIEAARKECALLVR